MQCMQPALAAETRTGWDDICQVCTAPLPSSVSNNSVRTCFWNAARPHGIAPSCRMKNSSVSFIFKLVELPRKGKNIWPPCWIHMFGGSTSNPAAVSFTSQFLMTVYRILAVSGKQRRLELGAVYAVLPVLDNDPKHQRAVKGPEWLSVVAAQSAFYRCDLAHAMG